MRRACSKKCAKPMAVLVILASSFVVHGFPTTAEGPSKPVTAPLDPKLNPVATDLPESDPSFERPDPKFQPQQISVSLSYNYDSVWISWVTGEFQIGEETLPMDPDSVQSIVHYRESDGCEDKNETGYSTVYDQHDPSQSLYNYASGIIHHVQLTGLKPKTLYQYRCGDPSLSAMSAVYYFRTMPESTSKDYPSRIVVAGSLGLTYNTSDTWGHILPNHPDLVLLVGGFSYADTYITNGTKLGCSSCHHNRNVTCSELSYGQELGYQPRWDYWGRFMEPLTANVPTMLVAGEHEIEAQSDNQTFVAFSSRFIFPSNESCSFTPLYYSFNAGGIHFIVLNPYTAYDSASDQYKWLENDLKNINRSETPWVVAAWTAPWYSTFKERYREAECMRVQLEDLLYSSRVDIVFNGEVDAYERSNRVYNYTLDPCGPVYMTVGAGGCGKLEVEHADDGPGNCSVLCEICGERFCSSNFMPWPENGASCPDRQPDYSAYRESSFGFGMLEVKNETHALWSWKRNQDSYLLAGDIIYIVRQPKLCPVSN
ncbi:PREDICTED: LOW QUALITY PROTEIN: purple acid phosphatase 13 [Tarenaya hassleriana]|uniref:LOW QUALITY PROTEIN: purple acid phosphatase 13 n=1 Tax=Tarenaya hassleriana TaxID=28532 RepID=UPI00053C9037|nr:PREDICTED: LOW QUALITY PROTEIN: purple acid phosphatase 13 [Tarenaya hassleriana]